MSQPLLRKAARQVQLAAWMSFSMQDLLLARVKLQFTAQSMGASCILQRHLLPQVGYICSFDRGMHCCEWQDRSTEALILSAPLCTTQTLGAGSTQKPFNMQLGLLVLARQMVT